MARKIHTPESEHHLYLALLSMRCKHLSGTLEQSCYEEAERLGHPGMLHEALTLDDFNELARIVDMHQEMLDVIPEPLSEKEHIILTIIHGKLQHKLGKLTDDENNCLESILEDWSWDLNDPEIERLDEILGRFVAERAPDVEGFTTGSPLTDR